MGDDAGRVRGKAEGGWEWEWGMGKGWLDKSITLVYSAGQMRGTYWDRERGIANGHVTEILLQCYKGAIPPKTPLARRDVDTGSALYIDCMQKVPVAKQLDVSTGSPEEYAARAVNLLGQDADGQETAPQENLEQGSEPAMEKQEAKEAKRT